MSTDQKKDSFAEGGLEPRKYIIVKADGSPVDEQAQYFVLRIDEDPNARVALAAYATSVQYKNPRFAADLWRWLRDTRRRYLLYREMMDNGYSMDVIQGP